jgi:hypothetical protein
MTIEWANGRMTVGEAQRSIDATIPERPVVTRPVVHAADFE